MIQGSYLGMPLELNERETHQVPYFRYCAEGEFRLQKCAGCGLLRYPPGTACPWCACAQAEWVPAAKVTVTIAIDRFLMTPSSFSGTAERLLPSTERRRDWLGGYSVHKTATHRTSSPWAVHRYGFGRVMRNTERPDRFIRGKYAWCVVGSTATTCACGPRKPSAIFDTWPTGALKIETTPASPAT